MKEVELEALQDASNLTRRILEEAKTRAEEKARRKKEPKNPAGEQEADTAGYDTPEEDRAGSDGPP